MRRVNASCATTHEHHRLGGAVQRYPKNRGSIPRPPRGTSEAPVLRTPTTKQIPALHPASPDKRAARRSGLQGKSTDAGTHSRRRGAGPGTRTGAPFGGLSGKDGKVLSAAIITEQTCPPGLEAYDRRPDHSSPGTRGQE